MSAILIRNVDDDLKQSLRLQAARNGRSMEEEARVLLREGLSASNIQGDELYQSIRKRVREFGGVDLPDVARELPPDPLDLGR